MAMASEVGQGRGVLPLGVFGAGGFWGLLQPGGAGGRAIKGLGGLRANRGVGVAYEGVVDVGVA